MHPEVKSNKPGRCPKCGMALTKGIDVQSHENVVKKTNLRDYIPLVVVISLITIVSVFTSARDITGGSFDILKLISNFMAGFFITFSGFKLMDLKGFATGYSTYDLLAQKWFNYGYIYPFIELFFGLAMIVNFFPTQTLIAEIIIMSFSGLGVAAKLIKGEKFQCACLGTFLKVPLTKITLVEDFGMAILAIILLILSK